MKIYRWAMRVAAPILFWLSVLVVVMSIVNVYDTIEQAQAQGIGLEGLRTISRFKLLWSSVGQSLLLGALPFGLAAIINRVDAFLAAREQRP